MTCAGLDMDYMGRAFETTAFVMAEASAIHRLTACCVVCGGPATHTSRVGMDSPRFVPGAAESYSPMCRAHWAQESLSRAEPTS